MVLDIFGWAPQFLLSAISSFSFLTHFQSISKGVLDLRDILYFLSLIAFWLFATVTVIDMKKAE
jgi:ABC-2 type transport system permease protein